MWYVLWYTVHSVVYTCDLILAHIWLLGLCTFINRVLHPLKLDFSGTTYVPTGSSTRRVNSCIRGTCIAWIEQLFIISMIRAYTDFHTYVLGVLFKAWIFFCVLFIYFVFVIFYSLFFEWLKLTIFLGHKMKGQVRWLTWIQWHPPSLNEAQ